MALRTGLKVNGSAEEIQRSNGHILHFRETPAAGHNRIELDFDSGIAEANRAVTRYVDTRTGANTCTRCSCRWMRAWRFRVSTSRI